MAASTSRVDRATAEVEIRSLLIRERFYRDTNRWDSLRGSWHPDDSKTLIEISWYQGGADGFVSGSRKMVEGGTVTSHTIQPIEVHINGNKAVSESTGSVNLRFEHEGNLFDLVSVTRFHSRLENVNGEWKLLTLRAAYDHDKINPAFPIGAVDLEIPPFPRPTYRGLAWSLARKGFKISEEIPGLDRPDSIETLVETDLKWLKE